LILVTALLLSACGAEPATATKPPEVKGITFGMVLVGPYNDHGWSEAHYTAGQYVEQKLPGAKMLWIDKVNPADRPGVKTEQVIADLIAKGAKAILTTSDDFKDDARLAAEKYPNIPFLSISADDVLVGKNPKNLGNFMGKMEYGKMIAGCAAALTTETGKLGYLGPLINDETRRLAASAYLGANYCWSKYRGKPAADLKFTVTWIGFWFTIPGVTLDATKEANNLFNAGADVVLSGIDTTEAIVVAGQKAREGKKVWAIPYDFKGACAEAPDVCLGVPYFNWGPGYLKILKEMAAGTWKPAFVWEGPDWKDINNPDTSHVGYVIGPGFAEANKARLNEFIKGLADGSINVFKGPLFFQDGSVYLKENEVANWEKQVWFFPQLLKGMEGKSK